MKNIIAIVGTNSDQSTNRDLLYFIKKHFATKANIEIVEIADLPLFDKPEDKVLPQEVITLSKRIEGADAVIISTPEYDHSVTASLMSALSWLSYGNFPFVDKPVMITGASYGTLGSSRALSHLRQILNAPELKARIMPSSEFLLSHSLNAFDKEGKLKDQNRMELLEGIFEDFLIFVDVNKKLMHAHEANVKTAENFSWEEGE